MRRYADKIGGGQGLDREARLFRALGDPIRLRLAVILAAEGETCVCELSQALGEPACKISRHLGVMRAAGLVQTRRAGTWMHYRLADAESGPGRRLGVFLRDCLIETATARADRRAVRAARGAPCCKPGPTGATRQPARVSARTIGLGDPSPVKRSEP